MESALEQFAQIEGITVTYSCPNYAWNPDLDSRESKQKIHQAVQTQYETLNWGSEATQEVSNLMELAKAANTAYNQDL
ncbi:hypothetical protein [Leptolyngbya sp. AN10]|uniref:hypothetical protein n=1 Tax=Leptolyngbya sp. AN10 TaxID=3423365 RepID=UPI003D30FB81